MAAHGHTLDYVLLWSVSDNDPGWIEPNAIQKAGVWPGFPANPIQPNPIDVDTKKYVQNFPPMPPLGGRKTKRGQSYVSLSNYNNLP